MLPTDPAAPSAPVPKPIGKYMTITRVGDGWRVQTRDGGLLGRVSWLARWNQYEFCPAPGTGYSAGCCRDLARFLDSVTNARKMAREVGS